MQPVRKILVGVDFSAGGAVALDYGAGLAELLGGAELVLAHVLEPVPAPADATWAVDLVELERQLEESAAKRLDELATAYGAGKVRITLEIRRGVPYRELVDAASDLACDLIVLGTHGRSGLSHMLLGSTAERVVRHAACPVLTIRYRGRHEEDKRPETSAAG